MSEENPIWKTKSDNISRVKPLSPDDIMEGLDDIIPGFIIEAVNNLLKKKFRGSSCSIKQKDIESEIINIAFKEGKEITSGDIYDNKWMDFEAIFIKVGWKVIYHKPDYTESYDSYFDFKK